MQLIIPPRTYQYNDFINFNIRSNFRNIPQEQIPYLLADIANEIVSKSGANLARALVYNILLNNYFQNQEFYAVASDIISIVAGRLAQGVSVNCISGSVINEYLSSYTGFCILNNSQLSNNLPANQVAAAQQNAQHFQILKEEVSRVNYVANQQMGQGQMYPQQQMGYPMQSNMPQQQMGFPMQQMGFPMQPNMGFPMQPMPQQQMGFPMQQMSQPASFAGSFQQPFNPNQATQTTNKFTNSNVYTQKEEVNVFNMHRQEKELNGNPYKKITEHIEEPVQSVTKGNEMTNRPQPKKLVKRDLGNYIEINKVKINLDHILFQPTNINIDDSKYFHQKPMILSSLKDAIYVSKSEQIAIQGEDYVSNIYGTAVDIVTEYVYMNNMSDVINECVVVANNYEDFSRRLALFYEVIEAQASRIKPDGDKANTLELYEKFNFMTCVDKHLVSKINKFLDKELGLRVSIETMTTDSQALTTYLREKHGEEYYQDCVMFMNKLFTSFKENYLPGNRDCFNEYTEKQSDYSYFVDKVYIGNLDIDNSKYIFDNDPFILVNDDTVELVMKLKLLYKHAESIHNHYTMYIYTLDNVLFEVTRCADSVFLLRKVDL